MKDPVSELFAAVCSIAPTRRRRFLWAAWWTAPPAREPFRKPDAFHGGARTRDDALAEAERAAGRRLVEIEPRWARAWARVLVGQAAWSKTSADEETRRDATAGGSRASGESTTGQEPRASVWAILGVTPQTTSAELKRAYRKRALETHPDHGGSAESFRDVQRAYEEAQRRIARPRKRGR
jgi:hypothetical protein